MARQWTHITRDEESGLPTMLVQAIAAAGVLCVGEIICAPMFAGMAQNRFALAPWAAVACLLAVAFTYTVGFALLWCVESLGNRLRPSLMPVAYGVAGLLGFTIWGCAVFTAFINSMLTPLGLAELSNSQVILIGVNCAALGFAAFFLGSIAPRMLSRRKGAVIAIGVLTLVLTIFGAFALAKVYGALY